MRDNLFADPTDLIDFRFDSEVAQVFDDMVRRSVPGYQSMIEMVGLMAKIYAQKHSNYYDLGASTGAIALALGLNSPNPNPHIIAVDNSPAMVEKCQQNLQGKLSNFELICADIENTPIVNASIVVLNLTLQFIEPLKRQTLINKIHQGLNPNGVLIVSEKVHFDNPQTQAQMTALHLDFKRANGYSELEIATKRQSIENVLITDTEQTHLERFKTAGFKQYLCHFQSLNFASFVAIK